MNHLRPLDHEGEGFANDLIVETVQVALLKLVLTLSITLALFENLRVMAIVISSES